jgi:hypothetical protein
MMVSTFSIFVAAATPMGAASPAMDGVAPVAAEDAAAAGAPALMLVDGQHLADVRARLKKGDASVKTAVAALEQDANTLLTLTPHSVMDKGITPPSGDKHDYMSQAPYWWPDPAKADGRPYIRRDGERNPEIKKLTDHDALGDLATHVSTLGLAYYVTGREAYATQAARLVRTWFLDPATRMNPHLRFGQGIPGINDGRGIGIIETRGLPDLLDGVTLLAGSPAWTETDRAGLQTWMRAYATWLVESPHGREEAKNGNNHETWYDVQVAALALWTGQTDLARQTVAHGRDRIGSQIEPDGRMPKELERTNAFGYSTFNLTAFFSLATLGDRLGVDLWNYRSADGRSLRQALDYLVPFAAGDTPWTYPAIDGFKPGELAWPLRRAAVAWKEPKYRDLAARIGGATENRRVAITGP